MACCSCNCAVAIGAAGLAASLGLLDIWLLSRFFAVQLPMLKRAEVVAGGDRLADAP